ncbi:hypothetical protein EVB32_101 [Rhizobium phage RHph_TM39]|uniref:Uncharacterized protein n=2 Tax=Cuauhnahuacvirus TaxID=3044696 RepID=A0A7S5RI78_9CAUD|nr:hypothetical protein PQC16_gp101 [Rhizobium phage RHph_TM30]YP_010671250.1 hypothetical protein PQC17_gp101 [Rhizobium phage RHph_Y65]QIG71572.1 hypothetical protein EVB94_101 [Rhizobium phage RHph_TM40]QIG71935.1 hypothetical protein EVB95_101 [Rhizobium phage RHph_TM2_3B]QIG72297.1 hypothetical protein EVB96_101 [Rhizobium phage RHph_TM3_3_6]QIG77089.1 hypothetical protein EVB32_101 [Rhizobium phage RHph_TM39]QIG77427.1 hypothetical protein EVB61_099 [Rhizobium phage RHph_TM21B]QIG77688
MKHEIRIVVDTSEIDDKFDNFDAESLLRDLYFHKVVQNINEINRVAQMTSSSTGGNPYMLALKNMVTYAGINITRID